MKPRDIHEAHRAATPLELLFDLVSVIAIASAAAGLHHAVAEAHFADGIVKFATAFFGVWWAWMNYTWFASAYDNDDTLFRLLTMVIMSGALVMAAGINAFFESTDLTLIVIGYVIMRLIMVVLWLRAARYDLACRRTALWYAGGIAIAQAYWVTLLFRQPDPGLGFYALFALGAILEVAVPALAEKNGSTPWHRHHIMERYGLLTIIVLGETLLAAAMATLLSSPQGRRWARALQCWSISSPITQKWVCGSLAMRWRCRWRFICWDCSLCAIASYSAAPRDTRC
ncbi:MAG: low temperature requirement protein A [Phormidesmis sp.]